MEDAAAMVVSPALAPSLFLSRCLYKTVQAQHALIGISKMISDYCLITQKYKSKMNNVKLNK